jgi:hypothetical protein
MSSCSVCGNFSDEVFEHVSKGHPVQSLATNLGSLWKAAHDGCPYCALILDGIQLVLQRFPEPILDSIRVGHPSSWVITFMPQPSSSLVVNLSNTSFENIWMNEFDLEFYTSEGSRLQVS